MAAGVVEVVGAAVVDVVPPTVPEGDFPSSMYPYSVSPPHTSVIYPGQGLEHSEVST